MKGWHNKRVVISRKITKFGAQESVQGVHLHEEMSKIIGSFWSPNGVVGEVNKRGHSWDLLYFDGDFAVDPHPHSVPNLFQSFLIFISSFYS